MFAFDTVTRLFGSRARASLFKAFERIGYPKEFGAKVSVVVPIYNVERYLETCLSSILNQSYLNLEVLMVDDGSLDNSRRIADDFASRDPRFRVIAQRNAGLGAARNAGIREARGEFLTFVDSDDELALDAYARMVDMLLKSGSDFVIGGIDRIAGQSRWRDDWVNRVHGVDRVAVTLDSLPEATKNVSAWSKLYRREFFVSAVGEYPVNLLNEDQEPAAKSYALCRTFDVLAATTYFWRVREDGTSITQGRLRLKNLEDRIEAERGVAAAYREHASEMIQLYRWRDFLGADFAQFYRVAVHGDEAYWKRISDYLRELFLTLPPEVWDGVEVRERCLAFLVSTGDRETSRRMVAEQARFPDGVPIDDTHGEPVVDVQEWGFGEVDWPEYLLKINEVDTPMRTGLTRLEWLGADSLLVEGYCFVQNERDATDGQEVCVRAISDDGNAAKIISGPLEFEPEDLERPGTSFVPRTDAGVRFQLNALDKGQESNTRRVELRLDSGGRVRRGPLIPQDNEHTPYLAPLLTRGGELLQVRGDRLHGLTLESVPQLLVLDKPTLSSDRRVRLTIRAPRGLNEEGHLYVRSERAEGVEVPIASFTGLSATESLDLDFALPELEPHSDSHGEEYWRIVMRNDSSEISLPFPGVSAFTAESGPLHLEWEQHSGAMLIVDSPWYAEVHSIEPTASGVLVAGMIAERVQGSAKLVFLAPNGKVREPVSMHRGMSDNGFEAEFLFDPAEFVTDSNGLAPIFGLSLISSTARDPFEGAKTVFSSNRMSNGLRELITTSAGEFEVTDFGFQRSFLVRGRAGSLQGLTR